MEIGLMLSHSLRVDYTYLHPGGFSGEMQRPKRRLVLNNKETGGNFVP